VLYVGKATSLRSRVLSYFAPGASGEKPLALASQVVSVNETVCGSPLEAAVLEAFEINRLDPPYNEALRPIRGRKPLYCSSELLDSAHELRDGWIGPIPRLEPVKLMQDLVRSAEGGHPVRRLSVWIRRRLERDRHEMAPEVLQEGLRLFLAGLDEGAGSEGDDRVGLARAILQEGARVLQLRERGRIEDESGEEEAEEEDRRDPKPLPAGPEEVADLLTSAAASATRASRLARLALLLGDSDLVWSGPSGEGRLITREWSAGEGWPAETAGPIEEPLRFRLAAVVTAEIRRILRSAGEVELIPCGCLPLERKELRRLVGLPPQR
jgi:hypothetical protein